MAWPNHFARRSIRCHRTWWYMWRGIVGSLVVVACWCTSSSLGHFVLNYFLIHYLRQFYVRLCQSMSPHSLFLKSFYAKCWWSAWCFGDLFVFSFLLIFLVYFVVVIVFLISYDLLLATVWVLQIIDFWVYCGKVGHWRNVDWKLKRKGKYWHFSKKSEVESRLQIKNNFIYHEPIRELNHFLNKSLESHQNPYFIELILLN